MQLTTALTALLALAPAAVLAQDAPKTPAPRAEARTRVRTMEMPGMSRLTMMMGQPRLGLTLTNDSTAKGAVVQDVMDDSPAEKAGLKQGDIVTRMNGTALTGEDPAGTMADMAHKLEPGDTVKLDYRRNGSSHSATIVAADLARGTYAMAMPDMRGLDRMQAELPREWVAQGGAMPHGFSVVMGRPMGLQLVEMNAGLGDYFGTAKGLLVTDTPRDSTMPLRAGDVILTIGGRTPNSEGHAQRILGSYAPGETVQFEIMRKKSKQSVSWTVPEHGEMKWMQPMRREVRVEKS